MLNNVSYSAISSTIYREVTKRKTLWEVDQNINKQKECTE